MEQNDIIPHLFRTEYAKMVGVLGKLFHIGHIEIAEDIVSETFLLASESWSLKGLPENPAAWLYMVAKNKTKDYLKRNAVFANSVAKQLRSNANISEELEIDFSAANIIDSQLAMMFVVCHPCNMPEVQVGLALNLLCGFSPEEIAGAFLTNKKTIYKRLQRAKQKLKAENIAVRQPGRGEIEERLSAVATVLYLLYNEGYYSVGQDSVLRRELCFEAMRLTHLLIENEKTDRPFINALFSLMCFQASRFDARMDKNGAIVLYQDQDTDLWDGDLIMKGEYYLNRSSSGETVSKFHLEAGIAYWHANAIDTNEKWENILQLYNQLLILEYSPVAALNRTYALAKANGKAAAIIEAEKINLTGNYLYHALLGDLYMEMDSRMALLHLEKALSLVKSEADILLIRQKMSQCS
jgi:predicted RNA polymerase sigma factor